MNSELSITKVQEKPIIKVAKIKIYKQKIDDLEYRRK